MKKAFGIKIFSTLLIIVGVILILSPVINKMLIKNLVEKTQGMVGEISPEEIEENSKEVAIYDFSAINDVGITSTITENINFSNKDIIGLLTIEDLNISLPILKGMTNPNLLTGAVTMVPDIVMGKGNYSLAGHYMKDKSLLFGSLMDIQIGSIVKITDKKSIYEYEIYDTRIVPDTAFYMLEDKMATERGKPIITLMTCYYTSKNGKRFFALGELIDEYPYETGLIN